MNNEEDVQCFVMKPFVLDAYISAFGVIEELRAFPERMCLPSKAHEAEAVHRLNVAREALQLVRCESVDGKHMVAMPWDGKMESTRDRRLLLRNLLRVSREIHKVLDFIPLTWRVEILSLNALLSGIDSAYLGVVDAKSLGRYL